MSDICETIRVMRGDLDCVINKSDMRKTDVIYGAKKETKEQIKKKSKKESKKSK